MAAGRSILSGQHRFCDHLDRRLSDGLCDRQNENPARNTFLLILVLASMQLDMVIRLYGMMVILGDNGLINQILQAWR